MSQPTSAALHQWRPFLLSPLNRYVCCLFDKDLAAFVYQVNVKNGSFDFSSSIYPRVTCLAGMHLTSVRGEWVLFVLKALFNFIRLTREAKKVSRRLFKFIFRWSAHATTNCSDLPSWTFRGVRTTLNCCMNRVNCLMWCKRRPFLPKVNSVSRSSWLWRVCLGETGMSGRAYQWPCRTWCSCGLRKQWQVTLDTWTDKRQTLSSGDERSMSLTFILVE